MAKAWNIEGYSDNYEYLSNKGLVHYVNSSTFKFNIKKTPDYGSVQSCTNAYLYGYARTR